MSARAILLGAFLALAAVTSGRSQAPQPQGALELVKAMQAANKQLIKKQAQTIEALAEMQKTAEQIKVFSKRT